MPTYEGSHTALVPASVEDVWAAMLDYEAMPEWQSAIKSIAVLSRDEQGRGRDIAYEIDAKLRTVRYTLRQTYEDLSRIDSEYVKGDFRSCEGEWTFATEGGGTRARFRLVIDPGLPLPGRVVKMLNERVMRNAVEDLRRRFS